MNPPKRKYIRLPLSDWAELGALWEAGDHTLAELSDKYSVSPRAIQSHLGKIGSVKGSKAAEMVAAVKSEIFKCELENVDTLVKRAKETRETTYANATVVEGLIMAQLWMAQKDPTQAFKAATALKALSLAAAALERLHATKSRALGLDRESVLPDELPVLTFRDLSENEIASLIERDEDEDDTILGPPLAPSPCIVTDADGLEQDEGDDIVEEGTEQENPQEVLRLAALKAFGGRLVRGQG